MAKMKVDAEFAPIQDQIDTLKTLYTFFQDDMTESEKLQAQQAYETKKNKLDYDRQVSLLREKNKIENVASPSGNTQLYAGLSSPTATAIRAQVSKFSSEPTVTNFNVIQEGKNFVDSLASKTTNPADDQALIYSLAKVLDPNSVVREGEYATAQKYSQSWINSFGKSVSQAIAGTGFLSETARQNIKETINSRYNASKLSYNNLYNNYVSGINSLTGRDDGTSFLRDYAISKPAATQSNNPFAAVLSNIYNPSTGMFTIPK